MDIIALGIVLSELALFAIIMWHVPPLLPMHANLVRVCQILIVLIALFAAINVVIGGARTVRLSTVPLHPSTPSSPSIVR